jgi:hypothetical protein
MDVYHKILVRIFEITGGRETQDVDLTDLLKREGFFPSLDSIKSHLSTESWITDSPKPGNVRITHWGVAEAKKAMADSTGSTETVERDGNRLLAATRDLAIVIEEFIAKPGSEGFRPVEKKFSEMLTLMEKIKSMV